MDRKGILLVDDEAMALKYFSKTFGDRFPIYAANSTKEALLILEAHQAKIGVIVTDQRMPESSGIDLLKIVRDRYPHTVRILTTAYSEVDILVAAINIGAVHSFVSKPWALNELEQTLLNALDHYEGHVHGAQLFEEKVDEIKTKLLEERAYDVGLIAAKIGHYVHNALCPLTFLLDQLLDQDHDRGNYSTEFLQSVRAHIYDVARTLKDLEQVTVPVAPAECKLLNLEEILDKALVDTEIIRKQKLLQFEKMAALPVPPILGSPSQVENLFRFMITEEIVSLPAESQVRVRLSAHEVDQVILGANIEFEDFVPVSSATRAESLLHPFNLRGSNPREFGVFLVSCYFIARHHGGSLNVRIKEDRGLSFSFFLPLDPQTTAPVETETLRGFSPQSGTRR